MLNLLEKILDLKDLNLSIVLLVLLAILNVVMLIYNEISKRRRFDKIEENNNININDIKKNIEVLQDDIKMVNTSINKVIDELNKLKDKNSELNIKIDKDIESIKEYLKRIEENNTKIISTLLDTFFIKYKDKE